jgi:hypothetical protein
MPKPQSVDDPTEPAVTPEMQQRLQAASKTRKIAAMPAASETKLLVGNALLQKHTTIVFALIGTEMLLTVQIADRLIIGRRDFSAAQQADIDLTAYGAGETGVSRRHAAVYRASHTMSLVDLDSTNKTYLNGVALVPHQPRLLRDGDHVCFGSLRFHVHFAG